MRTTLLPKLALTPNKENSMSAYCSPEKLGLTEIASIEKEPDYDFDMVVVWKHEAGTVYWAADSGCSCPSPFEDYHRLEDLHVLPDTMDELKAAVERLPSCRATDEQEFWKDVRKALRKRR